MNEQQLTVPKSADGFLTRMADILDDEKVKSFFRDYFSTWSDSKTALMMMHTYVVVDDGFFQATGERMPSQQLCAIVKKAITDRECRPILVEAMKEFMHGGDEKFFKTFQRIAMPQITMNNS